MPFGLGSESRLAFSVFISIVPMILSIFAGLTHVDPDLLRFCRSFKAREWQVSHAHYARARHAG